jgi:hypothetical protein
LTDNENVFPITTRDTDIFEELAQQPGEIGTWSETSLTDNEGEVC